MSITENARPYKKNIFGQSSFQAVARLHGAGPVGVVINEILAANLSVAPMLVPERNVEVQVVHHRKSQRLVGG